MTTNVSTDGFGNYFVGRTNRWASTTSFYGTGTDGLNTGDLSIMMQQVHGTTDNLGITSDSLLFGAGVNAALFWRPNTDVESGTIVSPGDSLTSLPQVTNILPDNARFGMPIALNTGVPNSVHRPWIRTQTGLTFGDGFIADTTQQRFRGLTYERNWAAATENSLGIFSYTDPDNYSFVWQGILEDVTVTSYPGSLACICVSKQTGEADSLAFFRVNPADAVNRINFISSGAANYPINCLNGASSSTDLFSADLYLRDDNPPFFTSIGRAPNLLIGKGAGFEVGQNAIGFGVNALGSTIPGELLGGSPHNYYKVVANFGTDKLLMRTGAPL